MSEESPPAREFVTDATVRAILADSQSLDRFLARDGFESVVVGATGVSKRDSDEHVSVDVEGKGNDAKGKKDKKQDAELGDQDAEEFPPLVFRVDEKSPNSGLKDLQRCVSPKKFRSTFGDLRQVSCFTLRTISRFFWGRSGKICLEQGSVISAGDDGSLLLDDGASRVCAVSGR